MARITAVKGFPLAVIPDGGGFFSPVRTQTMSSREGTLAQLRVREDMGGCCGGETACCETETGEGGAACCPDCDAPVPDTATGTGTGGVLDSEVKVKWDPRGPGMGPS